MAIFGSIVRRSLGAGVVVGLMAGCGGANMNKYLAGSGEEKSADYLVERARYYYDEGDFTKAADYAEQALALNSENEEAVVIAGYTYLSQAGIDPFNLARGLVKYSAAQSKTTSTPALTADAAASTSSSGNSASLLLGLSTVLGLSDTDKANLTRQPVAGSALATAINFDPTLAVSLPACANDVRATISKMKFAAKVITTICPFVDVGVRLTDDSTEKRHICTVAGGTRKQSARLHFLWSFGHMAESLALSTVLLATSDTATASSTGSKKTNLEMRIDKAKAGTDVSQMLTAVNTTMNLLDEIYPLGSTDTCSLAGKMPAFWALLNDMKSTSLGFAAIPGMPEDMSKQLNSAMSGIVSLKDKGGELVKLKAQMNAGIATSVKGLIEKSTTTPMTAEQKAALCTQYKTLNPTATTLPTGC